VTRQAACSPAGMHGLNEASEWSGRKPFAPRHRFCPATDQSSGARPRFRFSRSLLFDAAFRSSTAMTFLANRLRSQVNAPGLHLQSRPDAAPEPVRSHAPALVRLFCLTKHVRRVPPVVRFLHQNPSSVPGLSLPSRTSRSLGLVALRPVPADETYLAGCPIFLHSPQP